MMRLSLLLGLVAATAALRVPAPKVRPSFGADLVSKIPAAATAASISVLANVQTASAKSIRGVNGALDFGPLAGAQPGGEGTGKALGVNDDSLFFALGAVTLIVGLLFAQWQSYQDDDEDFFDTYDSRRTDNEGGNRNRF